MSILVNITGFDFWKQLKSLRRHFESTVPLVFPVCKQQNCVPGADTRWDHSKVFTNGLFIYGPDN